jgi:aryl-alcohol dehydrogenase-like predicted oxidoreductase
VVDLALRFLDLALSVVDAGLLRSPMSCSDSRSSLRRRAPRSDVPLPCKPRTAYRQAMHRAPLGPLTVSRLALGAMLMGDKTPEAESHRMLDRFLEAGGNFIDTADVYGDGGSERTLAPWLARRRDEVVLATKVRFAMSDPPGEGLAPDRIRAACDASLRRLGTDVIDLYQVHAPDPAVALEETLEALDGLVRAGKVRALGASNFPAWLLAWAVALQDRHGWSPFVSLQAQYSLVERSIEIEALPFCRAAGLGVLPWGPLGAGFLTGRYRRDAEPPPGSRMATAADDLEEAPARRAIERNFRVIDEAEAIAAEHGATVAQVALAWLLGVEGVVAPIIGPRTMEQLEDLLGAIELQLTEAERARLEAPAPPPDTYPQRMLAQQVGLERVSTPLRRD